VQRVRGVQLSRPAHNVDSLLVATKRFTGDELVQLIVELPMGSEVRSAYAQMLAERRLWEQVTPYMRELCTNSGTRRAEDTTLDWICSELGSDNWRGTPGWLEDVEPPPRG
jgi:hypothetical protein